MPSADRMSAAVPKRDGRKLVKTKTPGVFKRVDGDGRELGYCVIYRANGKQRREYVAKYDQARSLKAARKNQQDLGEWQERSSMGLLEFVRDWLPRYRGRARRGFRENTRREYERLLEQFAYRYFDERLRLADLTPHDLAKFVGWLADPAAQARNGHAIRVARHRAAAVEASAAGRKVPAAPAPLAAGARLELADQSIANAVMPVRAALASAVEEGLIRHNPAARLSLPHREVLDDDDEDEDVKALTPRQVAGLLGQVHGRNRLFLRLMAATGLRVSEQIALQRKDLRLDGSAPHVRVRRACVRRHIGPPKSRHGKRSVPIPQSLVSELRQHVDGLADDAFVFPSANRSEPTPMDPDAFRIGVLKPVLEEVGAPWAGFHSLRHTYASLQLARGANVLQLSRALGHHSPAFTLATYCHLLDGDMVPALDIDDLARVNARVNEPHASQTNSRHDDLAGIAL